MILGLGLGNAYRLIFNSVLFNEFYVFIIVDTFYFFYFIRAVVHVALLSKCLI